jgi:hypothetical protein
VKLSALGHISDSTDNQNSKSSPVFAVGFLMYFVFEGSNLAKGQDYQWCKFTKQQGQIEQLVRLCFADGASKLNIGQLENELIHRLFKHYC